MTSKETAAVFVEAIRQAQSKSGKKLAGRVYLSNESLQAIRMASIETCSRSSDNGTPGYEVAEVLLQRFEEMYRRQGELLPDQSRTDVLQHLIAELHINKTTLDLAWKKAIPVTLYCGAIAPLMIAEFQDFVDTPSASWLYEHDRSGDNQKPDRYRSQACAANPTPL